MRSLCVRLGVALLHGRLRSMKSLPDDTNMTGSCKDPTYPGYPCIYEKYGSPTGGVGGRGSCRDGGPEDLAIDRVLGGMRVRGSAGSPGPGGTRHCFTCHKVLRRRSFLSHCFIEFAVDVLVLDLLAFYVGSFDTKMEAADTRSTWTRRPPRLRSQQAMHAGGDGRRHARAHHPRVVSQHRCGRLAGSGGR